MKFGVRWLATAFEEEGLAAYSAYQIEREDEPLEPGEAFPLVEKLLRIEELLGEVAEYAGRSILK